MDEILNGKYRKLEKNAIGKGGQATVFLCEQITDKKKYNFIIFLQTKSNILMK